MDTEYNIIIAGAGGIAQAVGLILAQRSEVTPKIFIGNRTLSKAQRTAEWIQEGTTKSCKVEAFHLSETALTEEMKYIFNGGDIILDCLPGSQAPRIAKYALEYNCHYANLTEHVQETNQIIEIAKNAETGFILQSGIAPGYIDILGHHLFRQFCKIHNVRKVDLLELKVGALTDHAVAPHYYGFTWSPVGVATEYLEDAIVLRDYRKTFIPALSERSTILIDGFVYEQDLTSGGAADLPDALAGKVKKLDYKTLRYPGHYTWIDSQLSKIEGSSESHISDLQQKMELEIPHIDNDQIILYAAVQGKDKNGVLRRKEHVARILPQRIGKHVLKAIQVTTASPLIQAAQLLLETNAKGIILQSHLDPKHFLEGNYISPVFGYIS